MPEKFKGYKFKRDFYTHNWQHKRLLGMNTMSCKTGNQPDAARKTASGPVNYRYGKTVTYMTTKGRALSKNEVHTRMKEAPRVFVHYVMAGKYRFIDCVEIDE